jgi:RNA polymerase sigma factor (sigma-70 family)
MNGDSLDALVEQLNRGDDAAAEQVFRTYEPYLRKVVRRLLPAHLRPKFDSVDVVQSVWADVFAAFRAGGLRFGSVAQLRAFLVRATRNRFIDRVRQHQTAASHERPGGADDLDGLPGRPHPRPSEVLAADELWDQLVRLCPHEHRELLQMSRHGATAAEIAARVGLHEGSVRRILRDLALRLACSRVHPPEAT